MKADPAALDAAAQQAHDLSRRWTTAAADVEPETRSAIGALGTGFSLRAEVENVLSAHTAEVTMYARYLQEFGDALSATATDYRTSDATGGNRFWYLKER
ncbi:hypothetical protein QLQ12_36685 [Actinoplanes sp. NEAU-A12]|uniref:PE domain-containing protein n=1 Tax=Actinoplanes sandaracinus TaxID=3045177 RepID=A0ABT6WWP2_9ACTN|nr:hypothetical protein [Actinoplanes sandaracinus]MDI6104144.1 hypothetical protein [Actinoplanes sandaracinus]